MMILKTDNFFQWIFGQMTMSLSAAWIPAESLELQLTWTLLLPDEGFDEFYLSTARAESL